MAHGVVRYLELVKLAALIERAGRRASRSPTRCPRSTRGCSQAATAEQREIFETSRSTSTSCDAERDEQRAARARRGARRAVARGVPAAPRRRADALGASDIETYRTCPLKYKFARVFRIPSEPTLNQRFGILVHQVLERYHAGGTGSRLAARAARAARGGLAARRLRRLRGGAPAARQGRRSALRRYHERFRAEDAEPVWFERAFQFRMGPHVLRGRVDRVDRLPDGGYELIDYKTGRPRTAAQLREDVQLSLYAVGAREAWELEAAQQAYYYVLDDEKVPVAAPRRTATGSRETVLEVADGILAQGFEPTPSTRPARCATTGSPARRPSASGRARGGRSLAGSVGAGGAS